MNRMLANLVTLAAFGALSSPAAAIVDGSFDTSFAGIGYIAFPGDPLNWLDSSSAQRIIVEANGNLLLGGHSAKGWWLGELDSNGSFAHSFGETNQTGRVTSCYASASLCSNNNGFEGMAVQTDGRIAVVDSYVLSRTVTKAHSLDTGGVIGGYGYVSAKFDIPIASAPGDFFKLAVAQDVAQTVSGKWLVAGLGSDTRVGGSGFGVIQLNADLSLDTTFNATVNGNDGGGQVVSGLFYAGAVLPQTDGRIVLAGSAGDYAGVARLNADGSFDTSFGAGTGKTVLYWNLGKLYDSTRGGFVKIDRVGRVVVATTVRLNSNGQVGMAVMRLLPDGTFDTGFGAQGISYQGFQGSPVYCTKGAYANALALDSAGRILVAGQCRTTSFNYFFLERLHGDDGSLDTSFGIAGTSHGLFSNNLDDSALDVAFDASGRPVIAGYTTPNNLQTAAVARLTYDLIFTNNLETAPPGRLPGQ